MQRSPTQRVVGVRVNRMLTELVVLLAVMLLEHAIHAFLAISAACLLCGVINRRSSGDKLPFARAARRDLGRALIACQRIVFASTLVVAAACGFVAGHWGGWFVAVVAGTAVWATWGSLSVNKNTERTT